MATGTAGNAGVDKAGRDEGSAEVGSTDVGSAEVDRGVDCAGDCRSGAGSAYDKSEDVISCSGALLVDDD